MRLPESLRLLRSRCAQGIALCLRAAEPLLKRARLFCFECQARAKLRGTVAPGVQFFGPIQTDGEARVDIGAGTRIGRNVMLETYGGARIRIGAGVTINDGVTMCAYHGVTVGDYTMIGEYASIRDANHGTRAGALVRDQPHEGAAISIGRDCWIARGAIVLRGVTMEAGAVAAANSVVNRDVAINEIAGGVPARPIGFRKATDHV